MVITLHTPFIPLVVQAEEGEKQERIPARSAVGLCSSYLGAVTILLLFHDTTPPQQDGMRKHCGDRRAGRVYPSAAPDVSKRMFPSISGGVSNFQSRNIRQLSNG